MLWKKEGKKNPTPSSFLSLISGALFFLQVGSGHGVRRADKDTQGGRGRPTSAFHAHCGGDAVFDRSPPDSVLQTGQHRGAVAAPFKHRLNREEVMSLWSFTVVGILNQYTFCFGSVLIINRVMKIDSDQSDMCLVKCCGLTVVTPVIACTRSSISQPFFIVVLKVYRCSWREDVKPLWEEVWVCADTAVSPTGWEMILCGWEGWGAVSSTED